MLCLSFRICKGQDDVEMHAKCLKYLFCFECIICENQKAVDIQRLFVDPA